MRQLCLFSYCIGGAKVHQLEWWLFSVVQLSRSKVREFNNKIMIQFYGLQKVKSPWTSSFSLWLVLLQCLLVLCVKGAHASSASAF